MCQIEPGSMRDPLDFPRIARVGHGPEVALPGNMTIRAYSVALLGLLAACGGTTSTSGSSSSPSPDSGPDRSQIIEDDGPDNATAAEGGGFCCEPSDQPGCCMKFGGWSDTGAACGKETCDGFKVPRHLTKDSHGCDVWTDPDPSALACGTSTLDRDAQTTPVPPAPGDHSDASFGQCCPPSAAPACCMDFGGWHDADQPCGLTCDGFARPTRLSKDAHGCDVWVDPAGPVCGTSTLDAAADAP